MNSKNNPHSMKKYIYLITIFLFLTNCNTSSKKNTSPSDSKPKLVVGIVIDQMRYDYLSRYYENYGKGGFKRLLQGGYNLKNTHYNYAHTKTAIGHASIYTGTTPENHGILGNDWYDKNLKKEIYSVGDDNFKTIGSNSNQGNSSPKRLMTTTIGDQLHLAQNMNGKNISISLKNRAAILSGGHTANAAYWFDDGDIGQWISSSYYMDELPSWLKKINASDIFENYLSKPWTTSFNLKQYKNSQSDDNRYEDPFEGEEKPIFPHHIENLREENNNFLLIRLTPFGNSLTTDLAISAIDNENLGMSDYTDLLSISYTSTDEVGHRFGPRSIEVEDTFIRLDKDLERLFTHLDKKVGKDAYTVFLTSDHGVSEVPKFLEDIKIPSGYKNSKEFWKNIRDFTKETYGIDGLVEDVSNNQVYLNHDKIRKHKIDKGLLVESLIEHLITYNNVYKVVSAKTLQNTQFTEGIMEKVQKGYNQKFSGDILFVEKPSMISDWYLNVEATNHGSPYSYDTHVPLLFYGNGIEKGETFTYHPIVDIAPTISALLGIQFTDGNSGKVITEVLK